MCYLATVNPIRLRGVAYNFVLCIFYISPKINNETEMNELSRGDLEHETQTKEIMGCGDRFAGITYY